MRLVMDEVRAIDCAARVVNLAKQESIVFDCLVVALATHGIFDLTHAAVISNPGVPKWWPEFCLTYDVTAAGYFACLLKSGRIRATA
jgi:hypothetical protein